MRWRAAGKDCLVSDPPGYAISRSFHGETQTYLGAKEGGRSSEIVHVIRAVPIDSDRKKEAALTEMKAAIEKHARAHQA